MKADGVREELVRRLRRNLIGPSEAEDADLASERLPEGEAPSRWYLAGFLAPSGEAVGAEPATGDAEDDLEAILAELDGADAGGAAEDDGAADRPAARRRYIPSSIGVSTMVDPAVVELAAEVSWGDYVPEPPLPPDILETGVTGRGAVTWRRLPA